MKSIVLVNPVRYSGYGYVTMIKNIFDHLKIVAVWTSKDAYSIATNAAMHLIDHHIIYENDWDKLLFDINKHDFSCFINGEDTGFVLADRLQSHFFPDHCNDIEKQIHRISKFNYLSYLRDLNLASTNQFVLTLDTLSQCKNKKLVVKPTNGAGNINVHIDPDYSIIKSLLDTDIEYMVQDFVNGPEYCMEISSYHGRHRCTMASVYKGDYLVDNMFPWREENELVSPNDPNIKILYDYVVTILDALGIRLGLTWTQVKMDNGTPHLVEINFRSQGRAVVGPIHAATGNNWAMESLKSYLHLASFTKPMMYDKFGDFNKICVNNYTARHIDELDWGPVENLQSTKFCEKYPTLFPGIVPVSKNFPTVMGMIMIQNNNSEQYYKDLTKINEWKARVCG